MKKENINKNKEADEDFKTKIFITFMAILYFIALNFVIFWSFISKFELSFKSSFFLVGYMDISLFIVLFLERIKKMSKITFILKYFFYGLLLIFFFITLWLQI